MFTFNKVYIYSTTMMLHKYSIIKNVVLKAILLNDPCVIISHAHIPSSFLCKEYFAIAVG